MENMSHITLTTRGALALFGASCSAVALVSCSAPGAEDDIEAGESGNTEVLSTVTTTVSESDDDTADSAPPAAEPTAPSATETATADDQDSGEYICDSEDLNLSILSQQGVAGSVIYSLGFQNDSDRECQLQGFPGVSFVGEDNGTQIGAAAIRENDASTQTAVMAPGQSATVEVRASRAENYGPEDCGEMVPVDGFRIYPPGNTAAVYLPINGMLGCTSNEVDLLSVQPVKPA